MANPVNVLFILRPTVGGIRQHVVDLTRSLAPAEIQPFIVCPVSNGAISQADVPSTPILNIDIKGEISPLKDLKAAREIAAEVRKRNIHLLHAQGVKAGLISTLAKKLFLHDIPLLCTFHNPLRHYPHPIKNALNRYVASFTAWGSDYIVTVSNAIRQDILDLLHVPPCKITCIYNGLDAAAFDRKLTFIQFRKELGINSDIPLIGSVARLIPQKGIQYLIDAAVKLHADFPNARFIVVGDGPYKDALQKQAEEKGVAPVFYFTGYRADIRPILAELDIFVLPSLEEGFGISALEAMLAEKPVIASAVNGLPELVTPETGYLVPPADSDALYQALVKLLHDKALCLKMGQAGRERAVRNFSLQTTVTQFTRLYQHITAPNLFPLSDTEASPLS